MAKMIKGFKTLAQAKGMARPSLRFRGDHKQMEQFTQHPSLTILFEFKSKTNELKTQSHLESSHGITSTSIMPSFKVIRQSEIPLWITIIANVLLQSQYHAILRRPAFARFMAVPHYAYLQLKMPGPHGVITISGSFVRSDRCDKDFHKIAEAFIGHQDSRTQGLVEEALP